mgnify:CR=1 FL=1
MGKFSHKFTRRRPGNRYCNLYNKYKNDHRLSPPFSSLYVIITDRPGVPGFLGVSNSQTFCDKIIYGAINRRLAVRGFDEVYHKSSA